MPNAHIVPRSRGGLGVETNVVTLCTNFTKNQCHHKYDHTDYHDAIHEIIVAHMKKIYGDDWCEEDQVYKKYEWEEK